MKKNRPYQFVFGEKMLEHDSLIELKASIPEEEWHMMVGMTSEFYFQLKAIDEAEDIGLETKDRRMMRSFKRSLKFIEKLDPVTYARFVTDKMQSYFDEAVSGELSKLKASEPKLPSKPGSGLDIEVSNL